MAQKKAALSNDGKRAYSTAEAAKYIGMSQGYLKLDRCRGESLRDVKRTPGPRYIKAGHKVLYLKEDLDSWLERFRKAA